jgi:predicted NBD/HSP70 family sugar kinase
MGAVVDGVVVRGWRGALGEIGHLQAEPGDRACWCGREGCLETVASEPAIVRDVLAATGRLVTPDELADVADADGHVASILDAAGRRVGSAIATAATLLDPQRVVVSGEGVRLGHHYLDGLRHEFDERLGTEDVPDLVIEPWGDEAWARGAASLVLRELFHPAHLRDERHPTGGAVTLRGDPSPVVAS